MYHASRLNTANADAMHVWRKKKKIYSPLLVRMSMKRTGLKIPTSLRYTRILEWRTSGLGRGRHRSCSRGVLECIALLLLAVEERAKPVSDY